MTSIPYKALQVTSKDGHISRRIVSLNTSEITPNDLLIKVHYSSINYKDALSAAGNKGVTCQFPHTPGIDAAGEIVSSTSADFRPGDKVLVTGYDLGMNTWGGLWPIYQCSSAVGATAARRPVVKRSDGVRYSRANSRPFG